MCGTKSVSRTTSLITRQVQDFIPGLVLGSAPGLNPVSSVVSVLVTSVVLGLVPY